MRSLRITRLFTITLLLLGVPLFAGALWAQEIPGAIIQNGTVQLGVLKQGHLGLRGGTLSMPSFSTTVVGLRYMPTNGDATAPGCMCEGWGVADATTGQYGSANGALGISNLALVSFNSTSDMAVSIVTAFGRLRVTHDFHPSPATPNLYEVVVTMENISETPIGDLRYTRVMDWDISPFTFSEYVTIQGFGSAANLLLTNDNGFESPNPLEERLGMILFSGNAVDSGPADHGALFDFGFGPLPAGESLSFRIFYGAGADEAEALNALSAVGAEAYSLGQPRTEGGAPTDVPHTFIFAFTGIGGEPIVRSAINRPPTVVLAALPSEFYEGDPGSSLTAVADDPDGDTLVVTWVLTGPGNLSSSGLTATYTNPEGPALATVTVTVTDLEGESASASAPIVVRNVAPTMLITSAEINEGGTALLTVTVMDSGVLDAHEVSIDWNDGESLPTVVTLGAGTTTVTVSHAYLDDDPPGTPADTYRILGGVIDDDGGAGGASAAVKVNNVAPTLGAITAVKVNSVAPTLGAITASMTPEAVGTQVSISAPYTDPGTEVTHTCTVDWGDMTTSAGTADGGTCGATHAYSAAGVYTLTVTLTDDDTGVSTSTFPDVVVYDPGAGFVTGSGWINSPARAYVKNRDLKGRASFGFVAKYHPGATRPAGQTEFQFKAGDLNFHITEYEWLVVAGNWARYKGSGQINGAGDYGFELTLVDGGTGPSAVDKFRIRIFDKVGGGPVYDNNSQEIAGGSIAIHR